MSLFLIMTNLRMKLILYVKNDYSSILVSFPNSSSTISTNVLLFPEYVTLLHTTLTNLVSLLKTEIAAEYLILSRLRMPIYFVSKTEMLRTSRVENTYKQDDVMF